LAENEMDEMNRRASAALLTAIQAASQLAGVAIEYRVRQLRQAALAGEDAARQARAQAAAQHAADRAIWSATSRPSWWRDASAEDISRAWRAATTWRDVDPRAAVVRQTMTERLAEKGVTLGADRDTDPGDAQWLRAALDLADIEPTATEEKNEKEKRNDPPGAGQDAVIDGERIIQPSREETDRMADRVRAAWPDERADAVLDCKAWPALAERLHRLDRDGVDIEWLLRGLPIDLSKAHTPAALTAWMVDRAAADLAGNERARGEAQRAAERDERTTETDLREEPRQEQPVEATRRDDADRAAARADVAAARAAHHEQTAETAEAMSVLESGTADGQHRAAAAARVANPTSTRQAVTDVGAGRRATPTKAATRSPARTVTRPGRTR